MRPLFRRIFDRVRYRLHNNLHLQEQFSSGALKIERQGSWSLSAVRAARAQGIKVGLLRPISLRPFPSAEIARLSERVEGLLVVEMNAGQMLDDVRLAVGGRKPVEFYGRLGGVMPFPDEILGEIRRMAAGEMSLEGNPRERWLQRMSSSN